MKAAIYNPYWDTLGGGERYTLAFAECLANENYLVDIEWKDKKLLAKLEKRFGRKLHNIKVVNDIKRGDGYDICFWVSDGSIPLLRAKKNFVHFQFPFTDVNGSSLINKMKFFRISKFICNSYFTRNIIDKEYSIESEVIYPPVDTNCIKPKRKENLILYVGRFSDLTQEKRQDILIETFIKFYKNGFDDWKLVLAGGTEVGSEDLLKRLKKLIGKYTVDIVQSPTYKNIVELFGKAKFFWSATGFGVNSIKDPKKVEHFGISLVEAMSAGAVPVVYNSGGFKEIVKTGINGYLWNKKTELLKITSKLVEDHSVWKNISKEAKLSSKNFSYEEFNNKVSKII